MHTLRVVFFCFAKFGPNQFLFAPEFLAQTITRKPLLVLSSQLIINVSLCDPEREGERSERGGVYFVDDWDLRTPKIA